MLGKALAVRDRYQRWEISEHGIRTAAGRIEAELSRLLERGHCDSANLRLAQYLHHESPYSYTLLHSDGAAATNNRANGRCVGRRSCAAARV